MGLMSLYEKWNSINFLALAEEVLLEMDDFISDLNRTQLADKGIRPDGSKIEPEYTEFTKFLKSKKGSGIGRITSHVTLYGEGDLHESIFSNVTGGKLILDATDGKKSELLGKYGEWRGLTNESISLLQNEFRPKYVARIEKALQ